MRGRQRSVCSVVVKVDRASTVDLYYKWIRSIFDNNSMELIRVFVIIMYDINLTSWPSDPHPHEWTLQSWARASMWKSPEANECTGKFRKYLTSTGLVCVFLMLPLLPAPLSLSVPSLPKLVAPNVKTLPSVVTIALHIDHRWTTMSAWYYDVSIE